MFDEDTGELSRLKERETRLKASSTNNLLTASELQL